MMHYTTGRVYSVEHSLFQVCVGASLCGEQGRLFFPRVYATESWDEEETICRRIQNTSKVKRQFQRENVYERISLHLQYVYTVPGRSKLEQLLISSGPGWLRRVSTQRQSTIEHSSR